jgi:hypothetical protein
LWIESVKLGQCTGFLVQAWALAEHICFRTAPFFSALHDPTLQRCAGYVVDLTIRDYLEDRRQRQRWQSDRARFLGFNDEQMSGIVSRIRKNIDAVAPAVRISNRHCTPLAHEGSITRRRIKGESFNQLFERATNGAKSL